MKDITLKYFLNHYKSIQEANRCESFKQQKEVTVGYMQEKQNNNSTNITEDAKGICDRKSRSKLQFIISSESMKWFL